VARRGRQIRLSLFPINQLGKIASTFREATAAETGSAIEQRRGRTEVWRGVDDSESPRGGSARSSFVRYFNKELSKSRYTIRVSTAVAMAPNFGTDHKGYAVGASFWQTGIGSSASGFIIGLAL
jgi:hypothetical protein